MKKIRKILLSLAVILQSLNVLGTVLVIMFQRQILQIFSYQPYSYSDDVIIPVNMIAKIILGTICFVAALFLLKIGSEDEFRVWQEILCIIILYPIISVITYFADLIWTRYALAFHGAYYFSNASLLNQVNSVLSSIFNYSYILLILTAAMSIGNKLKEKDDVSTNNQANYS